MPRTDVPQINFLYFAVALVFYAKNSINNSFSGQLNKDVLPFAISNVSVWYDIK